MFQRRSSAKNNLSRNDFKQKKKYWCDIIHIQQQPTMLLLNLSTFLYNNCLISRALIGSFLTSIRVQAGKILIYASFQPFNFQLSNCQLLNQWHFIDFFMLLIKKREKLSTMSASFWIKNSLIFVYGKTTASFPSFVPCIWPFWGLVIVKTKLTSVFYASVLLLMINCVITLSKFTAEPLAYGSWSVSTQRWWKARK